MKILLVYSSQTGNTKILCEGVYKRLKEKLDVDIYNIKDIKNKEINSDYDIIICGFWVEKGYPNKEMKQYIENIVDKKVLLLGTLGSSPNSKHSMKVKVRTEEIINKSNEFLGVFLARGKVDEKLINMMKLLPMKKQIIDAMEKASMTSRETNNEDINNAIDFILSKLYIK